MYDCNGLPSIKVVGIGGAGNNTINRLYNIGVDGAEVIAIDTDKQHLDVTKADKKILVGKSLTRGLGAGGHWEVGRRAAELGRSTLSEVLSGADIVFITGGMGGGMGSGAAPVVAEVAREQGALVMALVCTPFKVERAHFISPDKGLAGLRPMADTVVILDNQRLIEIVPNLTMEMSLSVMDQIIAEAVRGIIRVMGPDALVPIKYKDFVAMMAGGGTASFRVGECKGPERYDEVVKMAIDHPLSDIDHGKATHALVVITGGPEMKREDAGKVVSGMVSGLDLKIPVAWGAITDKDYEGRVRVFAIAAGLKGDQPGNK